MKLNHTAKTISILLGIVMILGALIWKASAFTTKVEYKLEEGETRDCKQDSSITVIESNMDYLVQQARLKEIIDSLDNFDKIKEAKEIMKNNANTNADTIPSDTATNVFSTNGLGGHD